jgi:hypothetical protein
VKSKQSGIVEVLKAKHKERLARAQQELKKRMARPRTRSDSYISDVLLFSKWAYRVGNYLGRIQRAGADVIGIIVTRDKFVRFFTVEKPFQVWVQGNGVSQIEENVFRIT